MVILKLVLVALGSRKRASSAGDAGLDHALVEVAGLLEELLHVGAEARRLDGLGDGVGEVAALVGDVALALLFEGDADAMADELVGEGAGDAADAEFEVDLFEGGDVAGLEAVGDEGGHFVVGDALVGDAVEDLLGGEGGVADAVGHVEGPDGVLGVVDEGDVDGHGSRLWPPDGEGITR